MIAKHSGQSVLLPPISQQDVTTGLGPHDLQSILATVRGFAEVKQLVLFGSRAKGNHRPGSDIDLAIKGQGVTYDITVALASQLNQATRMPYFFDVIDHQTITDAQLLKHIDRVGLMLFDATREL